MIEAALLPCIKYSPHLPDLDKPNHLVVGIPHKSGFIILETSSNTIIPLFATEKVRTFKMADETTICTQLTKNKIFISKHKETESVVVCEVLHRKTKDECIFGILNYVDEMEKRIIQRRSEDGSGVSFFLINKKEKVIVWSYKIGKTKAPDYYIKKDTEIDSETMQKYMVLKESELKELIRRMKTLIQ